MEGTIEKSLKQAKTGELDNTTEKLEQTHLIKTATPRWKDQIGHLQTTLIRAILTITSYQLMSGNTSLC